MQDSVFQQKLQSVMTDNKFDRVIPKRRSGKLDTRNLWRVQTGAENVFKQKQARKGKEYNVVLLVDESGSMGTIGWGADKMTPAKEVVAYMADHLKRAGVHFAILGFNGKVNVHKRFERDFKSREEVERLKRDLWDACHGEGNYQRQHIACNHDYDGLQAGYDMLAPARHGKILIVFSDGVPNCDDSSVCGYDETKHRNENLRALVRANPDVTTIGVGILDYRSLAQIYDKVVEVDDLDQFKPAVISVLEKEIKRG